MIAARAAALALLAGCSAPDALGRAEEAYCNGLYVSGVTPRAGTVFFISPESLATATDGWGPQTLSLSIDQGFAPQVTYQASPSLSRSKNDITRSLQTAVGFSVTTSVDLTATSLVLVPTGAYYRLEAYPEYQVIDWSLRADACSFYPDSAITTGAVYRPVGVHFRVLVFVSGAWNALAPPTPAEQLGPPPWWSGPVAAPPPDGGAAPDGG